MQIKNILAAAIASLSSHHIPDPKWDAEELLASVLNCSRADLILNGQIIQMTPDQITLFNSFIGRRARREPLAYIIGSIPFYNLDLNVSSAVLIPRPETEWIVDQILAHYPSSSSIAPFTVWDLCTGSGAIGLSLKKARPKWNVILSDLSSSALEVATLNARKNHLSISVRQGDLFAPFAGEAADLIVINPPYIRSGDLPTLQPDVIDFEPHMALDGGVDGMDFYRRIASECKIYFKSGATLWMELGSGQGPGVSEMFYEAGFQKILVRKDLSGHDRLFFLE
jgi:release factor glutamine methyltransferase